MFITLGFVEATINCFLCNVSGLVFKKYLQNYVFRYTLFQTDTIELH